MKSPVFILPTKGATQYRGKYPARARSVSAGTAGLHVELNDGTRLWTAKGADHFADLPRVNADLSAFRDAGLPMTAEQYATLGEAADLLRQRAGIAGHGRRADLESRVRAIVDSIQPDSRQYAKRNAEAARREILAGETGRGFDPARPYRVRNRTPQFSGSFDFATLDEARAYRDAQLARRDSVVSGAAPVGPDANSQCPLQSFIVWADGTETLGDIGWTPPADGGARWIAPATVEPEAPAAPEAKPVRRDNVEYHAGKAAHAEGKAETDCPYLAGGDRAARWSLGFREAADAARGVIDMTPTWAGMGGTFRALIENGNAEGRRTAWAEIGKALALADERNAMAAALSALAIVANETAHCTGEPGTMARDEMDSALAAAFALLNK